MDVETYNSIIQLINDTRHTTRNDCYQQIKQILEQKRVNYETFTSIYGQHKRRIFKTNLWRKAKENCVGLYQRYQQMVNEMSTNTHNAAILSLASEYGLPPVLTARLILEGYSKLNNIELLIEPNELANLNASSANVLTNTKIINLLIKETNQCREERLAYEIFQCCVIDDDFGPCIDIIKNSIGVEYEIKLSNVLRDHQISFQSEEELRAKGFDKTPDFKLEMPIHINEKVISWVESKASFGDYISHQQYYEDQFKGYVNRFGPGLVIYWFGFIADICDQSNSILICDHFPTNFVLFNVDS